MLKAFVLYFDIVNLFHAQARDLGCKTLTVLKAMADTHIRHAPGTKLADHQQILNYEELEKGTRRKLRRYQRTTSDSLAG